MDDSIHNLRDALEWLDRRIREEAELDGEMSNDNAIQLGFITNMLEKFPLRNCDVGTTEEQTKRFSDFCAAHRHTDLPRCAGCPLENTPPDTGCSFAWAQLPYEAEEGGAK